MLKYLSTAQRQCCFHLTFKTTAVFIHDLLASSPNSCRWGHPYRA